MAHTHTAKAGALGRMAASRALVPRIVHTYHGFPFHEFQSRGRRGAYVAIERRLGRITDVALCVGTAVAVEAVRRELVAPDRIRTIGVAVEGTAGTELRPACRGPGTGPAGARPPRRRHGRGRRRPATYQKAPEDFLAALRDHLGLPGVIGVWVGGGELAATSAAWPRRAGRCALAGERADVAAILPAFDVFALPSRYEGLPTAVVEAMVCGVPVVATAVNAVSDVVIPGETGLLVPPQRPDLLARAVRYLIDRPAVAARLAGPPGPGWVSGSGARAAGRADRGLCGPRSAAAVTR